MLKLCLGLPGFLALPEVVLFPMDFPAQRLNFVSLKWSLCPSLVCFPLCLLCYPPHTLLTDHGFPVCLLALLLKANFAKDGYYLDITCLFTWPTWPEVILTCYVSVQTHLFTLKTWIHTTYLFIYLLSENCYLPCYIYLNSGQPSWLPYASTIDSCRSRNKTELLLNPVNWLG